MPRSTGGNIYIAVAVCSFCKWPEASPLRDRASETLFYFLYYNVIARYGAPAVVRTDQGTEFMG